MDQSSPRFGTEWGPARFGIRCYKTWSKIDTVLCEDAGRSCSQHNPQDGIVAVTRGTEFVHDGVLQIVAGQ